MKKYHAKVKKIECDQFKPEKDWRTNRYWFKKGQPTNLGKIKISNSHQIELFAWGQPTQNNIKDLYYCIDLLHPKLVFPTSYILFDNVDMCNPYDSTIMCTGYRRRSERVIQFYPYSFTTNIDHQDLENVSIWMGSIVHEFAHNQDFYPEIIKAWIQEFGWNKLTQKKVVHAADGSSTEIEHECVQTSRLITHYASYKPAEDFSESMVAFLFYPDKLDKGKLEFIDHHFGKLKQN